MFTVEKGVIPIADPGNPKNLFAEVVFDNDEIRSERRTFDIKTYARLRSNLTYWEHIQPANDFITKTLDKDEYNYLVRLFVRAKRDLGQIRDRASVMQAVAAIDEKVAKTFGKLALSERIFDYVVKDSRITMPDLTGIGTRPQDTKEKTFYEDEYHLINSIIIISKILFPIFGELINKIQHVEDTYSGVKEIVTFGIVNSLLNRDFEVIIKKLHNYISKIIDTTLSDDAMLVFHGITETSLTYSILAKMVVKNFVNHDLYRSGGNVMLYLAVTVKRAIDTETGSSNKNLAYLARILPETGDDGRNISFLENSINTTSEPVEIPVIVKIGVDKFITDYLSRNKILTSLFDDAVAFYKVTSLPPTPINELLVAMFVADPIGSAYCVKYMNMDMIIKIVVILQIYAMRMGFKELIPLLSLIPTGTIKTDTDEIDNHIIISDGRGLGDINYYVNLRELTTHLDDFSNFNFVELMKNLILFVVGNVHTFNVAPSIMELGNMGNTVSDDGIVRYDKNIIAAIYRFMHHMLILATVSRDII